MQKRSKTRKSVTSLAETPVSTFDALLKSLDLLAANLEAKYGAGLLSTLCTPETAGKFMRVHESLNEAIRGGDYDTVKAKVESLKRGWLKMEQDAKDSGYLKMVEAWYVVGPESGIEYIVARQEADTAILAAQHTSSSRAGLGSPRQLCLGCPGAAANA